MNPTHEVLNHSTPFVDHKGAKRFKIEGTVGRGAWFTADSDPNGI